MTKQVSADNAFRVVDALNKLGGTGRFQDIERGTGTTTSVTLDYAKEAISRGWVSKTGTPRSIKSRYVITDGGRAEAHRRSPAFTASVHLGSGPTDSEPTVVLVDDAAPVDSLRQRLITGICEQREWSSMLDLMQHVRRGPRDPFGGHEVQHILYALNQQGLITFVESRTGTQKALTKIRATKRLLEQEGVADYNREIGRGLNGQVPQHATDGTDFRTHQTHAAGGPITRGHTEPAPTLPAKEDITEAVPAQLGAIDAGLAAGRAFDEAAQRASTTLAMDMMAARDAIVAFTEAVAPVLLGLPLTRGLLARRSQLEMAAKLLEDAGQDELALAVLGKIDDYTPIEREAMNMFMALYGKEEG